jgi:dipeptidyl aminopeptidase/acylaminoacyl peptidase
MDIVTPASVSADSVALDNNDINQIEDIDKLDQVIFINEVVLTKFFNEEYTANAKYYLGIDAPNDNFNYKIMYESDDYEVAGYISAPDDYMEKNYPILIFNRGGYHYNGKVSPGFLSFLADLGFIAFATQHRGIDGGTGKDEFGGADVQDVVSLIDIAEQLPFSNGKIYMLGASRGGLETYRTLKEENLAGNDRILAAVILNGVSDLRTYYNVCPPEWKEVLNLSVGDTPEQLLEEYEKRSAVCWPELINTPLLICHGESDENVSVEQAEIMFDILKEKNKDVELKLYDGGHVVTAETHDYLIDWLLSH